MSTPEDKNYIRSAVHTSGGIRKSLLTPMRPIGLSRKWKKPSAETSSTPENKTPKYMLTPCRRIGLSKTPKASSSIESLVSGKLVTSTKDDLLPLQYDDKTPPASKLGERNAGTKKKHEENGKNSAERDVEIDIREDTPKTSKIKFAGGPMQNKTSSRELIVKMNRMDNNFDTVKAITDKDSSNCGRKRSRAVKAIQRDFELDVRIVSDESKSDKNVENKHTIATRKQGNVKPVIDDIVKNKKNIKNSKSKTPTHNDHDSYCLKEVDENVMKPQNGTSTIEQSVNLQSNLKITQNNAKIIKSCMLTKTITDTEVSNSQMDLKTTDARIDTKSQMDMRNCNSQTDLKTPISHTHAKMVNSQTDSKIGNFESVNSQTNTKTLDPQMDMNIDIKPVTKLNVRRSLSLKKTMSSSCADSSDDDDFVGSLPKRRRVLSSSEDFSDNSQPISCTGQSENLSELKLEHQTRLPTVAPVEDLNSLREEVLKASARVHQKELQLCELKQAVVYRRRHNVKELNELIEVWRRGSRDALEALLRRLQDNAPMSMLGLLAKLNIPCDMVGYDKENDRFK